MKKPSWQRDAAKVLNALAEHDRRVSGCAPVTCSAARRWKITRTIVEEYEAHGVSREEAIMDANRKGNPSSIKIIKETCTPAKE